MEDAPGYSRPWAIKALIKLTVDGEKRRGDEMIPGSHYSRGRQLVTKAASVFRVSDWTINRIDPDGLRRVETVLVWLHWFIIAFLLFQLVYRPSYGLERYAAYGVLFGLLVGFNAYTHYRLATNRNMTWHWIVAIVVMDVALISGAAVIGGGFSHYFFHLLYYPALAGSAVVFTSFRLTIGWVTVVSILYLAISLGVGDGIDIGARDEKPLIARIFVMYAVAGSVNLISGFERTRWRAAVERERALQQERVEFSQAVHDTTAQSAYMIGLGIDTARAQAGQGNPELTATLEETSRLSKSTIWELRHPINMGGLYEGRDLGWALRSQAASFTNVTSVPAEMTQTGVEPALSVEAKGLLFSIAHNALTNAYRHAEASQVSVHLEFGEEDIRLSVSDDGTGLPNDYAERGRGFANMSRDAERLGGRLVVEERGAMGGATVTCVMPPERG